MQIGLFAVFFQLNISFYSKIFRLFNCLRADVKGNRRRLHAGKLFNDSDSIIFETFSPLLLLV